MSERFTQPAALSPMPTLQLPAGGATGTGAASVVVLVMAIAALVRVIGLDASSLWSDEIFTRYYVELFGLAFVLGPGLSLEATPPLHYLALDGWRRLFGDSAVALRSLSVVASVLAIPIVYALGREFGSRRQALLGILLLALSPMAIYFAQEARAYAMLLVPSALVLLATARFLRAPERAGNLALYAAGAVAGIYCHATFALFMAACNLAVLGFLLRADLPRRGRALAAWIGVNAVVLLLGLPQAVAMASGDTATGLAWMPPLRVRDVVVALSALVTGVVTDPRFPGALLTVALLGALGAALWAARPHGREVTVLVAIPALFLLLIVAASLVRPVLLPRTLIWMTIPLSLLLAHGLMAASRVRPLLAAATVVTFAVGLGCHAALARDAKEPWRDVLGALRPELARAELVVLGPNQDPLVMTYYAPDVPRVHQWDEGESRGFETTVLPPILGIPHIPTADILRAIRDGRQVWVIANYVDQPSLAALLAEVPPPARRLDRTCGKYTCVSVLAWGVPR